MFKQKIECVYYDLNKWARFLHILEDEEEWGQKFSSLDWDISLSLQVLIYSSWQEFREHLQELKDISILAVLVSDFQSCMSDFGLSLDPCKLLPERLDYQEPKKQNIDSERKLKVNFRKAFSYCLKNAKLRKALIGDGTFQKNLIIQNKND